MAAVVVEYSGLLNIEALDSSFYNLFSRYAVLRGRVLRDKSGYLLYATQDNYPEVIIKGGDRETALRNSIEYWENGDSNLVKPLVVHDGTHGYLVFGVDHSIVDAASYFFYLSELWKTYSYILKGKRIEEPGEQFLPLAPSEICGGYQSEESALAAARTQIGDSRTLPAASKLSESNVTRQIKLDCHSTESFINAAKKNKVGVNVLMGGIMAATLREYCPGDDELAIQFHVLVDIRTNPKGYIRPSETTYGVSPHLIVVKVGRYDEEITLAQQLKKKIDDARSTMTAPFALNTHADINLRGVRALEFQQPDGLEFVDYFVHVNPAAQKRSAGMLKHSSTIGFNIMTFNRSLNTPVIVRPWPGLDANELIETFTQRLQRLSNQMS